MTTSPGRANARTWRANSSSNSKSFAMHVNTVGSAASDCAASGRRSRSNRATSSSAKCSESAALPPLPKV
jgi:hypothetical protein